MLEKWIVGLVSNDDVNFLPSMFPSKESAERFAKILQERANYLRFSVGQVQSIDMRTREN
jgi:hypothetical protein